MTDPNARGSVQSWVLLSVVALVLYGSGVALLAASNNGNWSEIEVFGPAQQSADLFRSSCQLITTLAAWFVIVVLPGWPWASVFFRTPSPAAFLGAAVACSVVAQTVVGTALKAVAGVEVTRAGLLALLLAVALVGLLAQARVGGCRQECIPRLRAFLPGLLLGLVFCAGVVLFLGGKIFVEAFDGDGAEAFELARSLTTSAVPWFDLENGTNEFGWALTQPPGLAYLHLPFLLLLGANEVSVRLLYLLCYAFVLPLLLGIVSGDRPTARHSGWVLGISILAGVCLVANSMFHSGWSVVYSDFAKCGEVVLVTAALAAIYFLRRDRNWLAVFFAVVASGVRWYGGFLMLIVFASFVAIEGRRLWNALLGLLLSLGSLAGLLLLAGHLTGYLEVWKGQFGGEHSWMLREGPALARDPGSVLLHFALFTGLLGPVVLWFPFLGRVGRSLSLATIAFLLFLSSSSLVLGHFYLPIVPLPALVVCCELARIDRTSRIRWLAAGALVLQIVALFLLWPRALPVNTIARELGFATCFGTDDYQQAVGLSHVLNEPEVEFSFTPSHHVWVYYAMRRPPDLPCRLRVESVSFKPTGMGLPVLARNEAAILYGDPEAVRFFNERSFASKRELYRIPFLRAYMSLPPSKSREIFGEEKAYRQF